MRRQNLIVNSGIMLCGLCLIAASLFLTPSQAASNGLELPDNIQCACSDDVLTFTCTIVGGGNTIWRGTAFDCPSTTNEIILRHSTFGSTGTSGTCNSGTIVGQSVRVEGTCFTSQLDVTVSESLNSGVVQCDYNSNRGTTNIGSAILNVVSASNPYPPPNDVSLINISQGLVTFNWTSVSSSCTSIDYVITSDCGVCPSSTNSTTVTCSDLQLPTQSDGSVCSFNVSSRVCGIVGNQTTSVLAVPDVPKVLSIVPLYANESQSLKRLTLTIDINNTRITTNDISGLITEYNVTYSTPSTLADSTVISAESLSCGGDACTFTAAVPTHLCSASSDINVTVSAANRIGQGPSSNIFIIDCTNMFVQVNFNSSTSIFSCEFVNKLDNSMKSCEISYHAVGSVDQRITVQNYTTSGNPYLVTLALGNLESGTNFYYIVTASSDESTDSVRIEGNYTTKSAPEKGGLLLIIVLPVVAVLLIVMSVVLIIIILLCYVNKKSKHPDEAQASNTKLNLELNTSNPSLKEQLKLQKITGRVFVTFKVTQNCSLREGFENLESKIMSWRGHVFYELTDEEEDITDDKELILLKIKNKEKANIPDTTEQISKKEEKDTSVNKEEKTREEGKGDVTERNNSNDTSVEKKEMLDKEDTGKLLTPGIDSNELRRMGFKGEGIKRSKFDEKYRVFVQSKGSGARHLAHDSYIIYEQQEHSKSPQAEEVTLLPVPSEYFAIAEGIKDDTTLVQFCNDLKLRKNKFGLCLELDRVNLESEQIRDVFVVDKDKKVYTGPAARAIIERHKDKKSNDRIFALSKYEDGQILTKDQWILYENPKHVEGIFRVLKVDEVVRMSTFVKKKIGSFNRGRAFYEFKENEDLPCCRKLVRMPKTKIQEMKSTGEREVATIEGFYTIKETPGIGISPPELRDFRDFIHDPSIGSRCLKEGTLLLYKIEEGKGGRATKKK